MQLGARASLERGNVRHPTGAATSSGATPITDPLADGEPGSAPQRICSKAPSAKVTASESWTNAWSSELGMPIRVRVVKNKEVREVGLPVEVPLGAADDDCLIGRLRDGSEFVMTDLSVGDYRAMKDSRGQKLKLTLVWEGAHSVTHNRLCLQQRADRCMVLSL